MKALPCHSCSEPLSALRLIPRESDTIALKQDVGVENFVNLGFSNVVKVENC